MVDFPPRHGRPCGDHPRLERADQVGALQRAPRHPRRKAWMLGTSPSMTARTMHHDTQPDPTKRHPRHGRPCGDHPRLERTDRASVSSQTPPLSASQDVGARDKPEHEGKAMHHDTQPTPPKRHPRHGHPCGDHPRLERTDRASVSSQTPPLSASQDVGARDKPEHDGKAMHPNPQPNPPKRHPRHGRPCGDHRRLERTDPASAFPRAARHPRRKAWMLGTSPSMTARTMGCLTP